MWTNIGAKYPRKARILQSHRLNYSSREIAVFSVPGREVGGFWRIQCDAMIMEFCCTMSESFSVRFRADFDL